MLKEYQYSVWKSGLKNGWPIAPFCVENVVVEGVRHFEESYAAYLICTLIHSGRVVYRIEGQKYELTGGCILLIPPNMRYSFSSAAGYRKQVLEIQGTCLVSILSALGLSRPQLLQSEKFSMLSETIDRIEEYLLKKDSDSIPELTGRTYALLHSLSQLVSVHRKPEDHLLSQALSLLENCTDNFMSIPEIARSLSLNERALQRMICKSQGVSPKQLRNHFRLVNARHLLQYTELSIKEIAFFLGYCNPNYFSSEFRRLAGVSPRDFRRNLAGETANSSGEKQIVCAENP